MKIAGIQKLTLLDYPGHTACTVFIQGCNFRCPFCHNSDLLKGSSQSVIEKEEFFEFLSLRKGKLDGVCITGGEPLLQPDVVEFIKEIRSFGFLVKIDTNGSCYEKLKYIIENKLCDYVAMDVKNIPEKYNFTCGGMVNVDNVLKSISLLINQREIDYEFRTTVVKEIHAKEDFKGLATLLKGAKRYYLQQYKHSEKVLKGGLSAYSESQMQELCEMVKSVGLENCFLRGI